MKNSRGKDLSNIAKLLHDGGTIKITDKMRRAFMRKLGAMAKRSGVTLRQPAGGSKKSRIRIPGRKYISDVFLSTRFQLETKRIYEREIKRELGL